MIRREEALAIDGKAVRISWQPRTQPLRFVIDCEILLGLEGSEGSGDEDDDEPITSSPDCTYSREVSYDLDQGKFFCSCQKEAVKDFIRDPIVSDCVQLKLESIHMKVSDIIPIIPVDVCQEMFEAKETSRTRYCSNCGSSEWSHRVTDFADEPNPSGKISIRL